MPITLLDAILIGVMLISAVLAMIRGFMREILSIAAWVVAALATLYSYGKLLPYAKSYVNNDIVATAVVVAFCGEAANVGGTKMVKISSLSVLSKKVRSALAMPSRNVCSRPTSQPSDRSGFR